MVHHVLSSALSTILDLAFAVLPAAPLFAAKKLPSSASPGLEQAAKKALSEDSAARTSKTA